MKIFHAVACGIRRVISVIAEVIVRRSGFHLICPRIRQPARGGHLAGKHLNDAFVTRRTGKTDPERRVYIAAARYGRRHGRVNESELDRHRRIDKKYNVRVIRLYVVDESKLGVHKLEIMLACIAAGVLLRRSVSAAQVRVHIHNGIAAFAARASDNDDRGIRIVESVVQHRIVTFGVHGKLNDGMRRTLHVRHAAAGFGCVSFLIRIEIPEFFVDLYARIAESFVKIKEAVRIPVESARAAGTHKDLLCGQHAEQVDLIRSRCKRKNIVIIVLEHDEAFRLFLHRKFTRRCECLLSSLRRTRVSSEIQSDELRVSRAQNVDDKYDRDK